MTKDVESVDDEDHDIEEDEEDDEDDEEDDEENDPKSWICVYRVNDTLK